MTINVTDAAAVYIKKAIEKEGGLGLRLGVKEVGCSGLTYTFDYAGEIKEGDVKCESNGVKVVVDKAGFAYLNGSTLDFERKGLNELIRVENPNAVAICGCGESFTVVDPI